MGQKPERELPTVRGDRLDLDFGKNKFRVDEKSNEPEASPPRRKLPPEPGRVPPATSVPWPDVLDSDLNDKKR